MLLMIDNYDSFTFNLVQYFGELGQEVRVFRNDQITVEGIAALKPDHLVLSPGPCSPAEAGICVEAIQFFAGKVPLLGVCLGHQAIGAALGGKVVRAPVLMHGKASTIRTDQHGVFRGLPEQFSVIQTRNDVSSQVVDLQQKISSSTRSDPSPAETNEGIVGGISLLHGTRYPQ